LADEPRPVGEALRAVRRQLGTPAPSVLDRVRTVWPDVVGEVLARHSFPLHLRAGVLRVRVDDQAWAGQFRYLTDTLVTALGVSVPDAAIREISVTAGRSVDDADRPGRGDPEAWPRGGGEPG
jgi:predicted nucleic acid-binding Zn ribbon protein